MRFGQLRRYIPEATRKVLTEQLRQLERDQIISRKVLGRKWKRVEYTLTPYGQTLVPVLTLMAKWGETHKKAKEAKNVPDLAGRLQRVSDVSENDFECFASTGVNAP